MDREWTDKRMDDFAGSVDRRFDQVDRRFDDVDRRFDEVHSRFDQVDRRFDRFEDKVEKRFDKVEADTKQGFTTSEAAIASLGEKVDHMSRTVMGALFTIVVAAILKLFVA
jgi:tetrahydromethanopterin S-methyltransferase subunit G